MVLNRLIKFNGNYFFLNFSFIIMNINILIYDSMDLWLFFFLFWKKGFFKVKVIYVFFVEIEK